MVAGVTGGAFKSLPAIWNVYTEGYVRTLVCIIQRGRCLLQRGIVRKGATELHVEYMKHNNIPMLLIRDMYFDNIRP